MKREAEAWKRRGKIKVVKSQKRWLLITLLFLLPFFYFFGSFGFVLGVTSEIVNSSVTTAAAVREYFISYFSVYFLLFRCATNHAPYVLGYYYYYTLNNMSCDARGGN